MGLRNAFVIDTTLNTDGVEKGAKDVDKVVNNLMKNAGKTAESFEKAFGDIFKKIPTEEYAKLESEFEKIEAKINSIGQKQDKFLSTGGKESSSTFKKYAYDIEELGKAQDKLLIKMRSLENENKAYEYAINKSEPEIRKETQTIKKQGEETKKATAANKQYAKSQLGLSRNVKGGLGIFTRFGKAIEKQKSSFGASFKTILKYTLGIRSMFVLFNKLRGALVEGFKNMAQFNDGVNPVNTSLSNLMSALTRLKNTFATAFAPILTTIEPALTVFINKVSEAVTAVGMLIAKLTGADTFTKAVAVQQDYAKSLGDTADNAEKANKQLADYDKLMMVNKDNNSKSSNNNGSVSPNQMFEEVSIPSAFGTIADKLNIILSCVISLKELRVVIFQKLVIPLEPS